MARYASHPIEVDAFEIEAVRGDIKRPDDVTIILSGPNGKMVIHLTAAKIRKHFPRRGDFYLIYDDGYAKILPLETFHKQFHPQLAGHLSDPINSDPAQSDSPSTP